MFSPKAVRVYRVTAAILKVLRGGDSDVTNYDIYRVLYSSVTQIYSDFVSLWIITLTYKARKRRLSGIRISSEPFVWFKFIQFIHTHTHTHTHRKGSAVSNLVPLNWMNFESRANTGPCNSVTWPQTQTQWRWVWCDLLLWRGAVRRKLKRSG